jgi:ribonuclease I
MSLYHLKFFKKMLISLAIFGMSLTMQMPANAQRITRDQLDRLSIQQVIIFRNEQVRQARVVIANCYNSPYIDKSICYAQYLQYQNLIANLDTYIAQRRVTGQ